MIIKKKKMKIETIVLIILIGVILISVVGIYTYRQIKFRALESSLENYLITEQGYNKSDILSIKASHGKLPNYSVVVHFKDEPNVKYVFTDGNANRWVQLSPVP